MSWASAKEMAEWIAAGGRQCYADDHEVEPAMFFGSETGTLILHPHARYWEGHPTDVYADIVFRAGSLYPWTYIGTCSETWVRKGTATDEELATGRMTDLPRGALEAAHEAGDTSVKTAVLAFVLDLENRFESYLITSTVENELPLSWDIESIDCADGRIEGAMTEQLMRAWEARVGLPEDLPPANLPMIAELLVTVEIASVCMVVNP